MKLFIFISLAMLLSCSPYLKYYPFTFELENTPSANIKSVIIAPTNLIQGIPDELEHEIDTFNTALQTYVVSNGLNVISNSNFAKIWNEEIQKIDGLFDSKTGNLKIDKLNLCLSTSIEKSCKISNADAVVLPSIQLTSAKLVGRYAFWDGIAREIAINSKFRNSDEFSWTGNSSALSLQIVAYSPDGNIFFKSQAGIGLVNTIVFKNNIPTAKLRSNLLSIAEYNSECFSIAFHPLIPFSNYPTNPSFLSEEEQR